MKKFFLLSLAIFIACITFGQTVKEMMLPDAGNLKSVQDSVILVNPGYTYSGLDTLHMDDLIYSIRLTQGSNLVAIDYVVDAGVVSIKSINGSYAALFPIWKKYFNPKADYDRIKVIKNDIVKSGGRFIFSGNGNSFTIFCQ